MDGGKAGPSYSPNKFSNRGEEKALVREKVRHLIKEDGKDSQRTIIFLGPKGIGKSWLLRELAHMLQNDKKLKTQVGVLFWDLRDYAAYTSEEAAKTILSWVSQQVAVMKDIQQTGSRGNAEVGTLARWMIAEIQTLLVEKPLVLLIDHIDEASPELLELLEDHCLSLVAKEKQTLIVLAGRGGLVRTGQGYAWKSPELKINIEEHELKPFDLADTRDQIERLSEPDALPFVQHIQDCGGGNPLNNRLLATQITAPQPPHWDSAAFKVIADTLMIGVPARLSPYFEALCILRAFDEERMPYLLATYHNQSFTQWNNYRDCSRIRQEMIGVRLARWNETLGGYALDRDLRIILENYLFERDRDLWKRLHCRAYLLYDDWARRYHPRWETEASYHAECLTSKGYTPQDCPTYSSDD